MTKDIICQSFARLTPSVGFTWSYGRGTYNQSNKQFSTWFRTMQGKINIFIGVLSKNEGVVNFLVILSLELKLLWILKGTSCV